MGRAYITNGDNIGFDGEQVITYLLNRAESIAIQAQRKTGEARRLQLLSAMAVLLSTVRFKLSPKQNAQASDIGREIVRQGLEEGFDLRINIAPEWLRRWSDQ